MRAPIRIPNARLLMVLMVLVASVIVVGLLAFGLIYWLPSILVGPEADLTKKAEARLKAENDLRSTLLQALAGTASRWPHLHWPHLRFESRGPED